MAAFYCSVFPDTHIIDENAIVIILNMNGQKIMLLNGGDHFKPNPSISFMYLSDDKALVKTIWKKLIKGGNALMDFDTYPWSEAYGWLNDPFGVSWQLYYGKPENIYQTLVPTLMFTGKNNGKAKEAIHFYRSIFPNSKLRGILEYSGSEGEITGNIQHGEFLIADYLLMIMDSSLDHKFNFNEGISLVVTCKDQHEIDHYWDALIADGGRESMCGWLKDRYGISWQIVPEKLGELLDQNPKAHQALLKMNKIEIQKLMA